MTTQPVTTRRRAAGLALSLTAAVALSLAACSSGAQTPSATGTTSAAAEQSPGPTPAELVVFGAASLKTTFTQLGETFQDEHPGVTVTFSFAGSQDLVQQLTEGAPADVLATADSTWMTNADEAGLLAGTSTLFASNQLTIAVPPGNPAGVTSLADLTKPELKLVICAPEVPCGSATQKVAEAAGLTLTPVSEEQSVTDVLAKVQSGEADAGLVYLTDVAAAKDTVGQVDFPESDAVVNHNPIAVLAGAKQPELAQEFVDLVTGPQGQQVLADAGFGKP